MEEQQKQQEQTKQNIDDHIFNILKDRHPDIGVVDGVRSGEIGDDDYRFIVEVIDLPRDHMSDEEIFLQLIDDRQVKAIMAQFTLGNMTYREKVSPSEIKSFYELFPSPIDFDSSSANFIKELGRVNSPEKTAEYEAAMQKFKDIIYGKQQQYFDQIQSLKAEASAEVGSTGVEIVDERIRSEIVSAFHTGYARQLVNRPNHGPGVVISGHELSQVYKEITAGVIGQEQFDSVLSKIKSPMETGRNALNSVWPNINKQMKRFIGFVISDGKDFNMQNVVDPESLYIVYQQNNDPAKLSGKIEDFKRALVENGNRGQKLVEYDQSLDQFQKEIYGDKFDYYKQIQLLKNDAAKSILR